MEAFPTLRTPAVHCRLCVFRTVKIAVLAADLLVGTGIADIRRTFRSVTRSGFVAAASGSTVHGLASAASLFAVHITTDVLLCTSSRIITILAKGIASRKKGAVLFDFMRNGGWMPSQQSGDPLEGVFAANAGLDCYTIRKRHLLLRQIVFHCLFLSHRHRPSYLQYTRNAVAKLN